MKLLRAWAFAALMLLGLFIRDWRNRYSNSDLILTVVDVGQGDGIFIQFPKGKTMLVDAGGGNPVYNSGNGDIVPVLTSRGVLSLDYGILSHPDQDHGMGFLGVMEYIPIKNFWLNKTFRSHPLVTPLMAKLSGEAKTLTETIKFDIHGVETTVVPLKVLGKKPSNNQSLVLFLEFGPCRIALTGDVEREAEKWLEVNYPQSVHLLKVAHHGSLTSSSPGLLSVWKPQVALISAGTDNYYGHPHRTVLKRLSHVGAEIFRTDFHGFLEFRVNRDGKVNCRTAHGYCGDFTCRKRKATNLLPEDLK